MKDLERQFNDLSLIFKLRSSIMIHLRIVVVNSYVMSNILTLRLTFATKVIMFYNMYKVTINVHYLLVLITHRIFGFVI